ncbi:IucA/IucC family protein [Halomonas binhaiensis]|uniref:AcsA protein n=1 Tax=Halomonas binhaiensis TaxID=2562282 RepID=A0A5C1NJA1_9GAMM|nr:IucA/IucC family protein [Halomonas binhaiensis]QEM82723.1 AcsA protein [Halomonas binhaiensis]
MSASNAQQYAETQIQQALVDGLLAEGFFDKVETEWFSAQEAESLIGQLPEYHQLVSDSAQRLWRWHYDAKAGLALVMLLRPGVTQAWEKVPGSRVLQQRQQGQALAWEALTPQRLIRAVYQGMNALTDTLDADELTAGQQVFLDALAVSEWQTASSVDHRVDTQRLLERSPAEFFAIMEQWASLLDRPYHPTAKAKEGMDEQEYRAYMAEFAQPVGLRWVAIPRERMLCGAGVAEGDQGPVAWVADEGLRQRLDAQLRERGLADSHVAIPVHPWQHQHALPKWLAEDFEAGHCVTLEVSDERWLPTSSLRSMAPVDGSAHYLKLPMAIYSLGASRYLPAVKMLNGDLSARLLHQARAKDTRLVEGLHLCDEGKWWAYMPPEATLFDEAPRHLSAMVRSYPQALLDDPSYRLIPMAALGTPLPEGGHHFFDDWLAQRGEAITAQTVSTLFGELCECFFDINLRMFRLGMLAEVHGQNAVLVWKDGRCDGLLLRDHDSLRIAVSRLEQHGMQDPCYRIKKGHSNTLYHDDLEALLFWMQTLAIQVNLSAIIDTLAGHYEIDAASLWQVMAQAIDTQIEAIPFEDEDRAMLREKLLNAPGWPYKLLIAPIIERAGGPGSMPFGKGETTNPFRQAGCAASHDRKIDTEENVAKESEALERKSLEREAQESVA